MEPVSSLIVELYETAVSPELWSEYLGKLRRLTDSGCLAIFFQDRSDVRLVLGATSGWKRNWIDRYTREFASISPFYAASIRNDGSTFGRFMLGDEMVPRDTLVKTEFYGVFMERAGWLYSDGGIFFAEGTGRGVITTGRTANQGPCSRESVDLFQRLMPHLTQAFRIRARLFDVESRMSVLADAVDRLAAGVVLLDDRGGVIHVNAAARAMIDERDGLVLTRLGTISTEHPDARRRLARTIGEVSLTSRGMGTDPGGVIAVPRPSGRRPYRLVVTPLAFEGAENASRRPFAAVFVGDPEREPRLPEEHLADEYGLTPAESRIAARLATGRALSDIADELEITINTARTHVKRIHAKTGTRRLTELVALVLRTAAGLR